MSDAVQQLLDNLEVEILKALILLVPIVALHVAGWLRSRWNQAATLKAVADNTRAVEVNTEITTQAARAGTRNARAIDEVKQAVADLSATGSVNKVPLSAQQKR